MKLKSTLRPALLLSVLVFSRQAHTQTMIAPPPVATALPPAMQSTSEFEVFAPASRLMLSDSPLMRVGPVAVRPHVFYRFSYGDGLASAGTNHSSSTIHELSPGVLLGLGDHWTLDYTPTLRFYSSKEFRDTLDHDVRLRGGTTYNG